MGEVVVGRGSATVSEEVVDFGCFYWFARIGVRGWGHSVRGVRGRGRRSF
jgi:hypothetical protein